MDITYAPLGDSAITVYFSEEMTEEANNCVLALFKQLQRQNLEFVKDIVPAYGSLTIIFNMVMVKKMSASTAYQFMQKFIETEVSKINVEVASNCTKHTIPVCYHSSLAPDLDEMARQKQMDKEQIIELHSSMTYRVYMIGFLPGFAYMGMVDEKIATPRKAAPANVLAGSVGIADAQTGIYPFNSPGGWNIIGQTPEPLFYPHLKNPCLFSPGDEVRFQPISLAQFNALKQA